MAHTDIMTFNGFTIRQLHSPDKKKNFGVLVLPENYDGKDNSLVETFDDVLTARLQIGAFDRRTIDNVNGVAIFRIIIDGHADKSSYAYMMDGKIIRGSLTYCRDALGWTRPASKYTLPKKAYLQNQPGYDPSTHKAK